MTNRDEGRQISDDVVLKIHYIAESSRALNNDNDEEDSVYNFVSKHLTKFQPMTIRCKSCTTNYKVATMGALRSSMANSFVSTWMPLAMIITASVISLMTMTSLRSLRCLI